MKYLYTLIITTLILFIGVPLHMVFTMESYEDCMVVYLTNCKEFGYCRGNIYIYPEGGHIEHIDSGFSDDANKTGNSYGCLMIDKSIISSSLNTVYCSMLYIKG